MRSALALAIVAWLVGPALGCGAARTTAEHPSRGEHASEPPPPPAARGPEAGATRPPSARTLAAGATFADLVASARRQDELRDQDSSAGCLLRVAPSPRLEADLAAAVRPLPEPPVGLRARLGSLAVLTRYGTLGPADAALGLVAFTTTRPPSGAHAAVLVVGAEGLVLTRTSGGRAQPLERSAIASLEDGSSFLFVTAEPGVSIDALGEVLAAIPSSFAGRVGLAVALPEGTRLPAAPTLEAPETAALCTLEPLPDEAWGELDGDALRAGVAPLVSRAQFCAGSTEGPGALGGRVVLSLRIGPEGRVQEACASEDATDDGVLRACLVRAARELVFAAPRGGSIDVSLPLRIEPGAAHRQTALCR